MTTYNFLYKDQKLAVVASTIEQARTRLARMKIQDAQYLSWSPRRQTTLHIAQDADKFGLAWQRKYYQRKKAEREAHFKELTPEQLHEATQR